MRDYTPYQRKIIDRYYQNFDAIQFQRLSELATELYLASGKKQERLWKQAGEILKKLEIPAPRVQAVLANRDPSAIVAILKEIESKR